MPTFSIVTRHLGESQIDSYVGKNGKAAVQKIKGAMEESTLNIVGRTIAGRYRRYSMRNLFLSAMFFQRVVSMTPKDEDYLTGMSERGKLLMHKADDDSVRDCWYASYNNKKYTAKYFMDKGCTFDKFNDRNEVMIIYNEFLNFLGKKGKLVTGERTLRRVHIDNTHDRYPMLEYGEYSKDGTIKSGPKYKHGVKGGYSVQAPVGMYRIVSAQFADTMPNVSVNDLMTNPHSWQYNLKRNGSIKVIAKMLYGKKHLSFKEVCDVARLYQE